MFKHILIFIVIIATISARDVTKTMEQYGDLGLYETFVMKSKSDSCKFTILHGDTFVENSCHSMVNSKRTRIVCTRNKKICKTEKELFYFAMNGKFPKSGKSKKGNSSSSKSLLTRLKNMTYKGLANRPIKLKNGKYLSERERISITFGKLLTKGNMTGDKKEEYVVSLYYNGGGSGVFSYAAIVTEKNHTLKNITTIPLGDRIEILSSKIKNKQLQIKIKDQGPNDAACCPTRVRTHIWTFNGNKLKKIKGHRLAY